MRTFLDESRLVDYQHAIGRTQFLDHVIGEIVAHRIGIPRRTIEQMLHAVGRRLRRRFRQLPSILAFDRAQQAHQIFPCALLHFNAAKPVTNMGKQAVQLIDPVRTQFYVLSCNFFHHASSNSRTMRWTAATAK
jgi:hypothetical protein